MELEAGEYSPVKREFRSFPHTPYTIILIIYSTQQLNDLPELILGLVMVCSLQYLRPPLLRRCLKIRRCLRNTTYPLVQSGRFHIKRPLYKSSDDTDFSSIADTPPDIVRSGKKHGPGIIILGSSTVFVPLKQKLTLPSIDTNNCIRFRHMANFQTWLEN